MKNENLYLRKAEPADMDLLFKWANNAEVRRNAFHTDIISYEEHKRWFEAVEADDNQKQYILMLEDIPIGQIRLSIHGELAELDSSIAENRRGNGYGEKIFKLLIEKVKIECPYIKRLVAKVKSENVASAKCLEKNGFLEAYKQFELKVGQG